MKNSLGDKGGSPSQVGHKTASSYCLHRYSFYFVKTYQDFLVVYPRRWFITYSFLNVIKKIMKLYNNHLNTSYL